MPEEKDIRKYLKHTFSDFEPIPEKDMWEDILANLDQTPRKKGGFWMYGAIAAGIALLLAIFVGFPKQGLDSSQVTPAEKNITEVQPFQDSDTLYTKETLVPNEESKEESPTDVIPSAPSSSSKQVASVETSPAPVQPLQESEEQTPTLPFKETLASQDKPPVETGESPSNPTIVLNEVSPDSSLTEEFVESPSLPERSVGVASMETTSQDIQTEDSKGFSIKDLSFEKALLAAGEELDKRFDDSPLSAREEEKNGETVRTFKVKIGGFSITHKKKVRQSKEKRT